MSKEFIERIIEYLKGYVDIKEDNVDWNDKRYHKQIVEEGIYALVKNGFDCWGNEV